ncbi:MAG TPA: carboxypeptidase-like regulatory domain-containing protein [Chitinophagaceae bacterium]|nr:TonB-dependent receptor [Chitinophagaceae bacterium]HMZ45236.1 carboxypeptidase-like regulatory domain-containing protein [Chitinophagaceae bacterium]HNE92589.1 carboxypeptidase-like regulatory domain-containing protein [Chitinophagaceae bacterium]HNF28796.1 carboxypeptidase-like regulatory domain-containing protein [Chitinophagaceae bacterium]HNM33521.1 carboxypeptidase-like regulatory domain-containing protein [Chitinophagaceae bacterium]
MKFSLRLLTLLALIILFSYAKAQNENNITLDLKRASFAEFVQNVEKQTNYFFYYNKVDTDSVFITISVQNATIATVLNTVFENTELYFSIADNKKIFVSRNVQLLTNLGTLFFKTNEQVNKKEKTITVIEDSIEETNTNDVAIQNKLIVIGKPNAAVSGKVLITGQVKNGKNNEPIVGAVIAAGKTNVVTDYLGKFTISLNKGRNMLTASSIGMRDAVRQLLVQSSGNINIEMQENITALKGVVVTATKRNTGVKTPKMGVEKITIKQLKQQPVLFGEADVLRAVLTLPGVTSVGEASTGFNVRGGSVDQNLILFNDATIFNPSHLFGFFSAFNPSVVKGVELYKGSIPEKFGGRISSVLDVSVQEGNKKKFGGAGGIGPLTSHLMFEGPIKKDKGSFIIGFRTTYSDWILKNLKDVSFKNSKAAFNDLSIHLSQQINTKNFLYITGYTSKDNFRLDKDTSYAYKNNNINIKWKHIFKNNLISNVTAGYDNYNYGIESSLKPLSAFTLKFNINQYYLKADFTKSYGNVHRINFGYNGNFMKLNPGSYAPSGKVSLVNAINIQQEKGIENAIYLGDKMELSSKLAVEAGIRVSAFTAIGSSKVYKYYNGLERDDANIQDTIFYKNGQPIKTYWGPEVRLSTRYTINETSSIKAGFSTQRQYIHMLSNTTAISPTDIWKLSDTYIKPQIGQQVSLGFYKSFPKSDVEVSVEVYYKWLQNFLDYKSGALLLLNQHIETDVLNSKGKAYGVEFMIKKNSGKLNGWLSYTYSRTMLQTDEPTTSYKVNKGSYYPANFDKPHSINFVGNYKFSHRFNVSLTTVYSTGRPITLPIAIYNYGGGDRVYYSDRNQYRIPDFFRADFSMNIEGNHKIKKLAHSSWSLGIYNITSRKNPYSVYFATENGKIKGYQLSIFGSAIPFITYNFKF